MIGLLAVVVLSSSAIAEEDKNEFGLGVVLGEPSGLNGQFYWTDKTAMDITAAWSWRDWFSVSADYQVYDYILDSPREWKWYWGGGAYMTLPQNEQGTFGVRIPLGIKYHIPHSPVDIWGEVDPALQLIKSTEPEIQGGIGITFWLK